MPDDRLVYDGLSCRLLAYRAGTQITIRPATAADLPRELRRADEIEYWPAQRWSLVHIDGRLREMTVSEEAAVRRWLDRLISGARTAHREPETITEGN